MRPSSASRALFGSIGMRASTGALRELGNAIRVRRAEDVVLSPGIGRDEVRHVLDDAEDRFL